MKSSTLSDADLLELSRALPSYETPTVYLQKKEGKWQITGGLDAHGAD